MLRNGRLGGLKFRRQHPIGPYTVDFYCHEIGLVIEVDGMSHEDRGERDQRRTAYLQQQGLCVFRVTNQDVSSDSEAVRRGIAVVAAWKPVKQHNGSCLISRGGNREMERKR